MMAKCHTWDIAYGHVFPGTTQTYVLAQYGDANFERQMDPKERISADLNGSAKPKHTIIKAHRASK